MEKRYCSTCVYLDRQRCVIDPPHILGIDEEGRTIQKDPQVHDARPACKWHMTEQEIAESDTIRMA